MSSDSDDDFLAVSPELRRRLDAVQATTNARLVSEAQARQSRADAAAERAAAAAARRNENHLARLERRGVRVAQSRTTPAPAVPLPREELVLDPETGKFSKKLVTTLLPDGSAPAPCDDMLDRPPEGTCSSASGMRRPKPRESVSLLSALAARSHTSAPAFSRPAAAPALAHGMPHVSLHSSLRPAGSLLPPKLPVVRSVPLPRPVPPPEPVRARPIGQVLTEVIAADAGHYHPWRIGAFPLLDAWTLKPTALTVIAPFGKFLATAAALADLVDLLLLRLSLPVKVLHLSLSFSPVPPYFSCCGDSLGFCPWSSDRGWR